MQKVTTFPIFILLEEYNCFSVRPPVSSAVQAARNLKRRSIGILTKPSSSETPAKRMALNTAADPHPGNLRLHIRVLDRRQQNVERRGRVHAPAEVHLLRHTQELQ